MRIPDNIGRIGGGGGSDDDETTGGSDPAPAPDPEPEPDPDPAPPVDDIQQPAPAPPEPEPDDGGGSSSSGGGLPGSIPGAPEPAPEPEPDPDPAPPVDDIQRTDPGPAGGGSSSGGGSTSPEPEPSGGSSSPDPAPTPPADTGGPGASGDIDFRFADQSDAIDPDPQFRNDSGARDFAERLTEGGRDVGETIGGGVADAVGAGPDETETLQSFASAGTTIPGSAATVGTDVADALGFATEPARDAVEPGAQLGFGDLADIGGETATRTGELGAAAGDAAIEGADTIFDIDFERRAEGEGAAISFTDDPQVRNQLAGELAFGAFSLGAAGPASSATRGAAAAASRGARSVADAGSSGASRAADALDVDDFVADTRAQQQLGGQLTRGSESEPATITADDLRDQLSAQDRARTADLPDRESDIDPGDAYQRRRDERIRGDRTVDDRSRDEAFERSRPDDVTPIGASSASTGTTGSLEVGSSAAGSGAAGGLGTLGAANDPTGIGDFGAAPGGAQLDPDQILGAGTSSTGAVSTTNDPTGITSDVTDQLGDGRLGGGTLPGDATGTGTDTDAGTDIFGDTDTGTDTGTDSGTDTFLDSGTTTDLDTTTPTTTSTPTRSDSRTTIRGLGATSTPDNGRPRFEDFEQDEPDDNFGFGAFESSADEFGSGILSGDEAAEQFFGR